MKTNHSVLFQHRYPGVVLDLSANGIGICRSLSKKGIKTFAFDTERNYKIGRTSYATCDVCPKPNLASEELLCFLLKLGKGMNERAVLYMGSDDFLRYVSTYRKPLSKYYFFLLPDHSLIEAVLDKRLTYQLSVQHHIPCPKTFVLKDTDQLDHVVSVVDFPCILKPAFSAEYRKKVNKKAIVIHEEAQLRKEYPFYSQFGEIIIQEYIPGDETCGYELGAFIDQKNVVKGMMSVQKISQYPPFFGTGTLLVSKKDSNVIKEGLSLLRAIGYQGLANIEFKRDPRDSQLKFIEINARPWLWHSLSEPCGIDFAYLYYLSLTGQNAPEKLEQVEGIKWLFFTRDLLAFLQKWKSGKMTFKEWLTNILSGKKSFALLSWRDPKPFFRKSFADIKSTLAAQSKK